MKVTVKHKRKGKGVAGIASLIDGPNHVKVGFPQGEADSDVIMRAVFNEFGTRGSGKPFVKKGKKGKMMGGFGGPIPERPFMRNALRSGSGSSRTLMKSEAQQIFRSAALGKSGVASKRRALKRLGQKVKTDIQDEITSLSAPPNSPLTIALKGSSNPLIDTGEMRKSVTYKVDD